jgi:DNA-binding response OmpR family regulator
MSRRATILVVEDDPAAAGLLAGLFEARNYGVFRAASGPDAEQMLELIQADVLVVDLLARGLDDPGLFTRLRRIPYIPIIVPRTVQERVGTILELRADPHGIVIRPASENELGKRVAEMLRPKGPSALANSRATDSLRVGQLFVDCAHRRVSIGRQSLRLTPTEYWLLLALVQRPGQVVSRDDLAHEMPDRRGAGASSLTVHMARLRAKLNRGGPGAPSVKAVRGRGYTLVRVPPATAESLDSPDETKTTPS